MAFIFDGKMKISLNEIEGMNGEIVPRLENELVDYTIEIITEMPAPIYNNMPFTDAFAITVYDNRSNDVFELISSGGDVVLRKRT